MYQSLGKLVKQTFIADKKSQGFLNPLHKCTRGKKAHYTETDCNINQIMVKTKTLGLL